MRANASWLRRAGLANLHAGEPLPCHLSGEASGMKCRSCFNALEQCCVVLGCKKISALERWTVRREQKPDRVEWWTNCDGLSPHLWRLFWFFVSRKWAFQLHLQSFAISDKGCHSAFYCHTVRPLVAFNLLQTQIAIFGGLFCGGSQQIIWPTEHIEGPAGVQVFLSVPEKFKRTCPCKELKIVRCTQPV